MDNRIKHSDHGWNRLANYQAGTVTKVHRGRKGRRGTVTPNIGGQKLQIDLFYGYRPRMEMDRIVIDAGGERLTRRPRLGEKIFYVPGTITGMKKPCALFWTTVAEVGELIWYHDSTK